MIKLEFVEVRVSAAGGGPVMLLKEAGGQRFLPVWITATAGSAVLGAKEPRTDDNPSTHDLLLDTLSVTYAVIERLQIVDESDGVFSAQLIINSVVVPCRVSDGVTLALRSGVGIWVEADLLERCGVLAVPKAEPGMALGEADEEVELFREFLDSVSADDFTDET